MTMKSLKHALVSIVVALGVTSATLSAQQPAVCIPLRDDEKTPETYSATLWFKERKTRSFIHGVVRYESSNGDPQEDVFVEVFDQRPANSEDRKRVAGCRTEATGRFEFTGLGKGDYLVRLSKAGGYQLTEILVSVSPRSKNRSPINAFIEVGH